MMRMLLALGCLGVLITVAGTANAVSYTLAAPVAITQNGVDAWLNPVTDDSGSIVLSDGIVDFATQDVFIVDVMISSPSAAIDEIGMSAGTFPTILVNPVGAGTLSGPGVAPTSVIADPVVRLAGLFTFGTVLDDNDQSVRLFITNGTIGDLQPGHTVSFMISSGTDFTVQGTLAVVPEPGTFVLVLIGVSLLAVRQRARA